MMHIAEANKASVIKIVQELLSDELDKGAITPALIAEKIALALALKPKWGEALDRDAVTDELIRRFSVWRAQDTALENPEGHLSWLTLDRKQDWRYWQRYREMQEQRLPWEAIQGLDRSSDRILGMLEDPNRPGAWDRRGLVVGHVQSGKTGNFTGVICKAADAGYKIIVVLAGMHNNLRSQTQMRLDEGFLGFETNPVAESMRIIGVGAIDSDPEIRPHYATNRTEKGDFIASNIKNLGITPEERPWLFVIKKNKTVLTRLLRWIQKHVADATDPVTGRRIVTRLPLLVIDDEADHGSVDTGENVVDVNGQPDPEHEPTAINGLIRRILHAFERKAYVGYTATPFANIYIHERGATPEAGPDLFPAAFIHNLGAPSNYIGPARVFGLNNGDNREGGLPLVREVSDHCSSDGRSGWMPLGHKNGHIPPDQGDAGMPASLCEAIDAFVLACAVRRLRGQKAEHTSMLVHVTRFNLVQKEVHARVESYIRQTSQRLSRRVADGPVLARLQSLWEADFVPATEGMNHIIPAEGPFVLPDWSAVEEVLPQVVAEISVRMINGTAGDVLDYAESAEGLKVIAIGGDKLARGLTLEGLCVSYFLRASRMYDTLMQMGRWFGYRPGYLDLCRLYTTPDLVGWFEHIADASEELREEFDMMVESGGTPREYGVKVLAHPVLMVTSRLKMRSAKTLYLSFSGHVVETVALHRDPKIVGDNFNALKLLLAEAGVHGPIPDRQRSTRSESWKGTMWKTVPHALVTSFLEAYRTHPQAMKVNSRLLAEFITSMAREGELTQWTVAVIGGILDKENDLVDGVSVERTKRTVRTMTDDRCSIGRVLSPKDEGIDVANAGWDAALEFTRAAWRIDPQQRPEPVVPSGPALRRVKGAGADGVVGQPEKGLLLVYLLDLYEQDSDSALPMGATPVVAFGISFPGSESLTKVEYKANNVLWEQEYDAGL